MSGEVRNDAERLRSLFSVIYRALRARVKLMAVVFGLSATCLAAVLVSPERQYSATALIQITGDGVNDALTLLRPSTIGPQAALTEARAIKSPDVIEGAIEKLDLENSAEFMDPGPSIFDAIRIGLGLADSDRLRAARLASAERDLAVLSNSMGWPEERLRRLAVIDALSSHLTVSPAGQSNVLEITATARSPEMASLIANAVSEEFIEQQRSRLRGRFGNAEEWFAGEIDVVRQNILELEQKIQTDLIEATIGGITADGLQNVIDTVNSEIARVEAEILKERDRLSLLNRAAEADDASTTQIASTSIDNTSISDYAARLASSLEDIYLMEARGDDARANERRTLFVGEMAVLRRLIGDYIESQTEIVNSREDYLKSLRATVAEQLKSLSAVQSNTLSVSVLQAEKRLSEQRLDSLSARATDFGSAAELVASQSEIVGLSKPPLKASGPGPKTELALALGLAGMLAVAAGLTSALFDRRIRRPEQLAERLQITNGPLLARFDGKAGDLAERSLGGFLAARVKRAGDSSPVTAIFFMSEEFGEEEARFTAVVARSLGGSSGVSVAVIASEQSADRLKPYLPEKSRVFSLEAHSALMDGAQKGGGYSHSGRPAIFCFIEASDGLAPDQMFEHVDICLVAAPWGRVKASDLASYPVLQSLARDDRSSALVYAAPDFEMVHAV